jgi:mannose-6-phosphate isomerase-like protein (cupin superfamily)
MGGLMNIVKYQEMQIKENAHKINARQLLENVNVEVIHIQLESGESLVRHITPVDVFFYVLEGEGVVEIGDEQEKVSRDMLIESPTGIPHRMWNESNEPFRVLVVKTPKPTKPTKIV